MRYFDKSYMTFFRGLEVNNTKEWFDAHKKDFEKQVKEPFYHFVGDIIEALREDIPHLAVAPKDCVFRINRDIRFSADKTPYKTQMSALVSPGGRKAMASLEGLYIELNHKHLGIYGGLYMPDKEQLADVRHHIANHLQRFKSACADTRFVKAYGTLQGEKNKRLDAAFMEVAAQEPLILNKQFNYQAMLPAELMLGDALLPTVLQYYQDAAAMRQFLTEAT